MAKKGGVQLLQADINTDEEFEKFLERSGLLVMDVYTEWCGPCLGMVGSLKKIKLELGGDNLQLAICKSDTITALERFRNKSEPTWLFASDGKAVNIMFGTNVPQLIQLITNELEIEIAYRDSKAERIFYEITELQPIEVKRENIRKALEEDSVRAETDAALQKRREYITYFTNEIMANLPDMGVTIFGPHISRDIFKKLMDPADSLNISCKDRKILQISPEMLEILHFDCDNKIDDEVLEQILNKDLLICIWKSSESETRAIEEVLTEFVSILTKPQPIVDEFGNANPDLSLPPIIQPLEYVSTRIIQEEIQNEEIIEEDPLANILGDFDVPIADNEEESEKHEESIKSKEIAEPEQIAQLNEISEPEEATVLKSQEPKIDKVNVKHSQESIVSKTILIPAVWTPGNKRTNAAAIYLFFRPQTDFFLPPDPIPEPPHLAIAFDAYKRKDVIEICEQYNDEILSYGYFSSSNPDLAKLLANSTKNYELVTPTVFDKLVIKVAKVTSHALLALSAQGPSYVSQNTVTGEKECLKFFPEGYKTGEVEEIEAEELKETSSKKKQKNKKKGEESSESVGTVILQADIDETEDKGDEEIDDNSENDENADADGDQNPDSSNLEVK